MAGLAPWAYLPTTVDLGFKINCSFGNAYRLTGDRDFRDFLLVAARSVTNRYNAATGCIGDPDTPTNGVFETALDYLMDLELLFNAAQLSGDTNLYQMALSDAQRAVLDQVQPDGSAFQIADYNSATGTLLALANRTWARGHAWGTYGLTMACR